MVDTVADACCMMETHVTTPNDLSDKALAFLAFAACHRLGSGDAITSVVTSDASGHHADPEALSELADKELGELRGDRFVFNVVGQLILSQVIDRIRGHI